MRLSPRDIGGLVGPATAKLLASSARLCSVFRFRNAPAGTNLGFANLQEQLGPGDRGWSRWGALVTIIGSSGPALGRIDVNGSISEYRSGITHEAQPYGIIGGPNRTVWFTEIRSNRVARAQL